ncbi:hypothetical protein [Microseira wollei]|uniref:hypothetical protein n=1 Tax=Microseira wollei TaxID=467598 RepID=UPI001CFF39F3|nr:hypothetical protein [Microseira wollei]
MPQEKFICCGVGVSPAMTYGQDAHATRKIHLLWGRRLACYDLRARCPCHKKNSSVVG